VKLFLNLELSRLRKVRKCIFGLCRWKTTTPRMHLLRCPRRPRLPAQYTTSWFDTKLLEMQ